MLNISLYVGWKKLNKKDLPISRSTFYHITLAFPFLFFKKIYFKIDEHITNLFTVTAGSLFQYIRACAVDRTHYLFTVYALW